MSIKLFSKSKPISINDMRTPDPLRNPTDFSDEKFQEQANRSSGYQPAGKIDFDDIPSSNKKPGALNMWSDDENNYREQKGKLWFKKR